MEPACSSVRPLAAAYAWPPAAALVFAVALGCFTAMIYACIRFIQEWAQPLAVINFAPVGLPPGLVPACALAALFEQRALLLAAGPSALAVTIAAWATRAQSLRRNTRLRHKPTL